MPLTAAIVGGTLVAAGAATAAKGAATKGVDPRLGTYNYGGSDYAASGYRQNYGNQVGLAQALGSAPLATYGQLQQSGATAQQQGLGTLTQALAPGGFGTEGGVDLSGVDPGAAAEAQSRATLAQAALRTNALGRTGGALGLRAAINANAGAGAQAAQQAAVTRAQAEQQMVQAQLQNQGLINQTRFGLAGLGQQQQGFGAGLQMEASNNVANIGLQREQLYNQQLSDFETRQMEAQIAGEQARQQSKLDKRRLIVGLGAGLIGSGASVMASGGGGGGGGGGGIGSMGAGGVTNFGGRK